MSVLAKGVNRRIGRAMHTYDMLRDGDRVLIAVSGGVDSLVLAWLLLYWRRKAPIDYEVLAVHIDNGFGNVEHRQVAAQLDRLAVPYRVESTDFGRQALAAEDGRSTCYHCARQRRHRLFELARSEGFNKIALGHHKDDIIETFFLNLLYGGNLSTMVPKQEFFSGRLALIRPLAYLEKDEIRAIAAALAIAPVKNPCPEDRRSKRQEARRLVQSLYRLDSRAKANIFAALANIREGYLLRPAGTG